MVYLLSTALKNRHIVYIVLGMVFILLLPQLLQFIIKLGLDNFLVRAVVTIVDFLIGAVIAIGLLVCFILGVIWLLDGKIKF